MKLLCYEIPSMASSWNVHATSIVPTPPNGNRERKGQMHQKPSSSAHESMWWYEGLLNNCQCSISAFPAVLYFTVQNPEAFVHCWQIDSNTDGLVDFPEFVAATLHVHQLEEHNLTKWQQRSLAAFEKFDLDRDGFITPEELRLVSIFVIFSASTDNTIHPVLFPNPAKIKRKNEYNRNTKSWNCGLLAPKFLQYSSGLYSHAAYRLKRLHRSTTRRSRHRQRWKDKLVRIPQASKNCKYKLTNGE